MALTRPGETCWKLARAHRVKFLIDGQAYFAALRAALLSARTSIHLLGWGFDPRIRLEPADETDIGQLLLSLCKAKPDLDVRVLIWRSALPISATQDFFPHRAQAWFRGSGVDFRLDAAVPFGACHHQKVVIIDGALAFVGSADLMPGRWDSPDHLDIDPRRSLGDHVCPPRHELMAMVDGPAAAAFDELFRERWADDDGPNVRDEPRADLWPDETPADLTDVDIGIARTEPAWRGAPGVREIAVLTLAAIAQAKRTIYIENQYFTWPLAVEALAARLAEPDGPEVVLIVSAHSPSYFDRITMDRARTTALWRLKAGDVFGRFHALAPHTAGGQPIVVHAKAMIVDDTLARVSSANLNNRSHGFDTECELVVEATDPTQRDGIAALRDRLAGHWVGHPAAELAEARASGARLGDALWALDAGARLRPVEDQRLGPFGEFIADFHLGDPTGVSDSWRLGRRHRKLLDESRALRAALAGRPG